MRSVGLDLHKVNTQVCEVDEEGTVVREVRIATGRDEFAKLFGRRERLRILLESATESEWVARYLEELGHEVIVADPGYAPMYRKCSLRPVWRVGAHCFTVVAH